MLSQKYMNPGFNHGNQYTLSVQTNAESYKVLHPIFAEIIVCKVDQFLTLQKVETP